ncbi:hypothetical protein Ciccas_008377 [Cichlidogyrus casuarinus]|uniref:Uncharacterized protein n=1 Tax=Cichlidogyrus casuarinus TaxID=1844966 RepID=A0ABD2Q053_9PLAT
MPYTGPCILCCGVWNRMQDETQFYSRVAPLRPRYTSEFDSFVRRAVPLTAYVHPKLSTLADIPMSIRLESRLVAPQSSVTLKPSKSNAILLSERKYNLPGPYPCTSKPDCLTRFSFAQLNLDQETSEDAEKPQVRQSAPRKRGWLTETRREYATQSMANYQNRLQPIVHEDIPAPGWRMYDPLDDEDLAEMLCPREHNYVRCPAQELVLQLDQSPKTEEDTSDAGYQRLHDQEQARELQRRCGRRRKLTTGSDSSSSNSDKTQPPPKKARL